MFAALEGIQIASLTIGIMVGICAFIAGLFAVFEKITGSFGRWFERHFKESLEPTNEVLAEIRTETRSADSYNRYHLGPNGATMPIHLRLRDVERTVSQLSAQDDRLRGLLQQIIDAEPEDE